MKVTDTITKTLTNKFQPEYLEVIDESYKHQGHIGWNEGGESHFKVIISAKSLQGTRLEKHKIIMNSIKSELTKQIHALSIEIRN